MFWFFIWLFVSRWIQFVKNWAEHLWCGLFSPSQCKVLERRARERDALANKASEFNIWISWSSPSMIALQVIGHRQGIWTYIKLVVGSWSLKLTTKWVVRLWSGLRSDNQDELLRFLTSQVPSSPVGVGSYPFPRHLGALIPSAGCKTSVSSNKSIILHPKPLGPAMLQNTDIFNF